jgi:hypothetical protein
MQTLTQDEMMLVAGGVAVTYRHIDGRCFRITRSPNAATLWEDMGPSNDALHRLLH